VSVELTLVIVGLLIIISNQVVMAVLLYKIIKQSDQHRPTGYVSKPVESGATEQIAPPKAVFKPSPKSVPLPDPASLLKNTPSASGFGSRTNSSGKES